ncbi:MAG: adenosylmethionine--8-amino-7-oxononanoate transaminase [Proteobacteria bacterium]|nr:adenosylmethionine--8-amino-7-oxononanoate transaminase [Pseudomonadota bacterium]
MRDSDWLRRADHAHVWHPFTPMRQWREESPLILERGDGPYLFDTGGRRYIDGISSLWCNVHGHRVPEIDQAIRDQLERVAHSTLLGAASPPSIELASRLAELTPASLNKVFFSDAGATALEAALKIAVGYWYHRGQPQRRRFVAFSGAYHGDTTGALAVGDSTTFRRPFEPMLFPTVHAPAPDAARAPAELARLRTSASADPAHSARYWPSEDPTLAAALREHCLGRLRETLEANSGQVAAVVLEPIMQGAAGMICQPPGFVRGVAELVRAHGALLIADEVAVGFGRTGSMFACEHEAVEPDMLCLAKGLSGGYLPLAATVTTDEIEQAFCGELSERRTFFHGHTYTGNALGCAAALASLRLFADRDLLGHIRASAEILRQGLSALRDCNHVVDVRQRGIMVGIELGNGNGVAAAVCRRSRSRGVILRPLSDVVVLMPIPAMPHDVLRQLIDVAVASVREAGAFESAAV